MLRSGMTVANAEELQQYNESAAEPGQSLGRVQRLLQLMQAWLTIAAIMQMIARSANR